MDVVKALKATEGTQEVTASLATAEKKVSMDAAAAMVLLQSKLFVLVRSISPLTQQICALSL